ncbi:MAG TPA: hypothetical protein PLC89_09875 [Haliscomenobacter sp.]|uniref:hypothetical protein n=1 Tax=Haliscomenobacter sp. TaxID=2717303 RepID=UPI002BE863C2|nr:hypothetical protein [Haliscomenobacter sp.]HOY17592.1 hypothetical protein [Haliscomenobacter sp.]
MRTLSLIFCFSLVFGRWALAQEIPLQIQDFLSRSGVELLYPVDSDYKPAYIPEHLFQRYDYAIRSNKEAVEIRILFLPDMGNAPHAQVNSYRMALHIGDNETNTSFTARELTERELTEVFNADWGRVYILKPKASFSMQQHCRFLVLHKENKGMVCVFYLFDKPSAAIDQRLHLLKYQ